MLLRAIQQDPAYPRISWCSPGNPSISGFLSIKAEDCSDYEDFRARGFVHRSLKLQSLARLFMGIQYPRSY
ncbi:hypothetical protein Tco_0144066 [Tanacetum coccineum]